MVLSDNDIEKIKGIFTDRFLQSVAEKVAHILEKKYDAKLRERDQRISKLEQEICDLKSNNCEVQSALDNQEQAYRNLNVRVFGVPVSENEDLRSKMQDIFRQMNINIADSQINKCHRVAPRNQNPANKKPPAVLLRFCRDVDRAVILKNRKYLRGKNIQVKEDLTKNRLALLSAAVNKFSSKSAWCLNGLIYVRVGDSVHRINGTEDLLKLKN